MATQEITLSLPEDLYVRLKQIARATQQSMTEVLLHAVEVGTPPGWDDIPAEYQADLAALDRLDDTVLWQIARSQQGEEEMEQYETLLSKKADDTMTATDRERLAQLRYETNRFMLRKAHAAALLRWRGHRLPPADRL